VRSLSRAEPPVLAAAFALAAAPARFALERHDWTAAAALTLPATNIPWDKYRWSESSIYFAAALGAARSGNLPRAKEQVAKLDAMHKEIAGKDKYAGVIDAQSRAASAWIAQADGRAEDATSLLRAAAELEESLEKHPVTPGAVLPARELLGDLLLAQQKPADALDAYKAALKQSPRRFNSTAGAMFAAERSGNVEEAKRFARELLEITAHAEVQRPELAQAKRLAR
jgi:tetratricopeptide (TPR) repeat protein